MATVPTYGPRRVETAPLPNARVQATETVASTGGVVGEAQAGFGEQVQRTGLGLLEQDLAHRQERTKRAQEVRLLTAGRQLGEAELLLRRKMAEVKGKDTLNLRAELGRSYDEQAGLIEGTLTTQEEVDAFRQTRDTRRLNLMGATDQYTLQQLDTYERTEREAAAANAVTLAVEAWDAPMQREQELRSLETIIAQQVQREGLEVGGAAHQVILDKARSQVHEGVITRMISHDRAPEAQAYFDRVSKAGQLTPEAATRIQADLKTAGVQQQAFVAANELMAAHPPADDHAPINIDQLEAEARKRFPDNPLVREATIQELRQRAVGINADRQARLNGNTNTVWTAVGNGAPPDAVYRSQAFLNLPGTEQVRVRKEYADQARDALARQQAEATRLWTEEQRAATRESREYTREQRLQAQADREQREQEQASMDVYYTLVSDPEAFVKMDQAEIRRQLPALGPEVTAKLIAEHTRLTSAANAVRVATIDTDLFRDVASRAGLDYAHLTTGQQSPEQRANLGALRRAVEEEISAQQGDKKRQLTYDEKRQIMETLIDQKIMVPDKGWFWFDAPTIGAILTPNERTSALEGGYVPIDDIPPADLQQGLAYLKQHNPTLTVEQIRARFARRLERAYALTLLKRTRKEVTDVLDGTVAW